MNQKMRASVLLILSIFLCSLCLSQTKNEFRLSAGYRQTLLVDRQASPLLYRSNEKQVGFQYRRFTHHALVLAELNASFGDFFPDALRTRQFYETGFQEDGSPKTGSWPLTGTLYFGQLRLGYLQRIHRSTVSPGKPVQLTGYAGLQLSNQLFYSDNIVRVGWLNSSAASAAYYAQLLLQKKHRFSVGASLALVARNTRLPYHNSVSSSSGGDNLSTVFKQGSRFVSPDKFQQVQVEAGYDYNISRKFGIGLHYSGQWLHYSEEMPLSLLQNSFHVSLTLKS